MRIGGWTTVQSMCVQYQMRDLLAGFAALGHEVEVVHENTKWADYDGDAMTVEQIMNFMDQYKPDLMVQMNGNRFHHPPLGPDVSWVNVAIDRMPWLFDPKANAQWGPKDLTLAAFTALKDELEAAGQQDVRYMPIGYNAALFNETPEPKDERFQVDVAFLCNLPPFENRLNRLGLRWDTVAPALWLAHHKGVKVGLYGAGWDQWQETRDYYVCNPTNGPETHALYQQAKVHLHCNEDMMIHMRPLECLGSGGAVACYVPRMFFNRQDSNCEGLGAMRFYKSPAGLQYILERAVHAPHPEVARLHSTAIRAQAIIDIMNTKGSP